MISLLILPILFFEGVDEPTSINCLNLFDWKLELAANSYFEHPDRYYVEPPPPAVDRRKVDSLFTRYRGL